MTLVTAPSGFGKTSAVASWADARPGEVAWLTLDAFDTDQARLSAAIVQAMHALVRSGAAPNALLAIDPETTNTAQALDALGMAVEGSSTPLYLVIDDAHRAAEALTTGLLGALLESGPEPLRLIVVGTSFVELTLARWTLTHPEAVIRSEQLAFHASEIAAVTAGRPIALTPEVIWAETQGWPIAVRFIEMTSVRPTAEARNGAHLLRDYVRDYVLGGLAPALAQFVLDTSVCAELTDELAAVVSGRSDASAVLRECAELGLFIDRFETDRGTIYRWHAHFARQCQAILESAQPGRGARLHSVAARYFCASDPLVAVSHWFDADDVEMVVDTILRHWVGIVVSPEVASLDQICLRLPASYLDEPSILLVRACAQEVAGAHEVAKLLFARAEARAAELPFDATYDHNLQRARLFLLDDRAEVGRASDAVAAQLQASASEDAHDHAALLYLLGWTALRHGQDPDRAVQLLSVAAKEAELAGDPALQRRALGNLAVVLAWAGRLHRAEQVLSELGDRVEDDGPWLAYAGGGASCAAGFIAYWRDDLGLAQQQLSRALRSGSEAVGFGGVARMLLAFAAAASKEPLACRRAAFELQDIPETDARGVSWATFRHGATAALAEAAGQRDRALAIATRYADAEDVPTVSVVLAGLVRRAGDPVRALQILRRVGKYERVSYVRVSTLITAAMVQRRGSNTALTHDLCEQALEIAEQEGIRRPFCDGDLEMRQLLTEHLAWGTQYEDFIAQCLRPRASGGPLDRLSARERAVFDQLRTSRTMAEIAINLELSINTVKTHQRSIYRKLEVTSRRDAIRAFS